MRVLGFKITRIKKKKPRTWTTPRRFGTVLNILAASSDVNAGVAFWDVVRMALPEIRGVAASREKDSVDTWEITEILA